MLTPRRSNQRGHFDHGWLKTYHTFSFGDYFDQAHMGHASLRVINEDWIKAGQGFGTHGHQNMEIVTYVISGDLAHKDSLGNGSSILPGDIQYMSAGSGVRHSEFNHAPNQETHLLQIWFIPNTKDTPPAYDQKTLDPAGRRNALQLLVSGDGALGSIRMLNQSRLYASVLSPGYELGYRLMHQDGYLQIIRGELSVNGIKLAAGDGAYLSQEPELSLQGGEASGAEFLLFDLA